jgi:hypothetical protein
VRAFILFHGKRHPRDLAADPKVFLDAVAPYRTGLIP